MTGGLRIVGGSLRGRRLAALPGSRPTSERAREALFDILGPWIEGGSVLELYAGSGAIAIEALLEARRLPVRWTATPRRSKKTAAGSASGSR